MAEFEIPTLPQELFKYLLERIQPVMREEKGKPHYIKKVDPDNVAYTWDPTFTDEAVGLEPFAKFKCLHTYGYYGMFKPSIGEVLRQIPEEHRDTAVAFEITTQPETASDLNFHSKELNAGFHVSEVTLYKIASFKVSPSKGTTRFDHDEPV